MEARELGFGNPLMYAGKKRTSYLGDNIGGMLALRTMVCLITLYWESWVVVFFPSLERRLWYMHTSFIEHIYMAISTFYLPGMVIFSP